VPPFAALLAAWLINACWPLIGQDGLRFFSVPLFFHAGMALGLAAMLPWLCRAGRWRRILSREVALPLGLMGLLSCTASIIYLEALRYTSPANAGVMAQVEVLYSAVLAAVLLGERIGAPQVLASSLVVAGTGLILVMDLGSWRWKGDLMILLTPWMYQVSHVVAKRLPKDLDPLLITGARLFYGCLVMLPLTLWSLAHGGRWSWSGEALRLLTVQGLFMSTLSLVMWYTAIRRLDLAKATAFLLSYPALTMLLSWALGRERIAPLQVAGLAVTMAGALWLSRITLAAGQGKPADCPESAARPGPPERSAASGQD